MLTVIVYMKYTISNEPELLTFRFSKLPCLLKFMTINRLQGKNITFVMRPSYQLMDFDGVTHICKSYKAIKNYTISCTIGAHTHYLLFDLSKHGLRQAFSIWGISLSPCEWRQYTFGSRDIGLLLFLIHSYFEYFLSETEQPQTSYRALHIFSYSLCYE